MRRQSLEEHILSTRKINGKRARGRQRAKIWNELRKMDGWRHVEDTPECEDRQTWRDLVTNASRHGTP